MGTGHGRATSRAWAVLLTDGTAVEYAPEVYTSRALAIQEAERWAWFSSKRGAVPVHRPSSARWQVGTRDVLVIEVDLPGSGLATGVWVVGVWSTGYQPEQVVVVRDRQSALAWLRRRGLTGRKDVDSGPWHAIARGDEGTSGFIAAHRAKWVK